MADLPASLFFSSFKSYGAGELTFDLITAETHNFNSTVTSHPVEDGSEITDHIQNEPESGSISGLISNFSIFSKGLISNRAQDAFDLLYEMWKARELVTIVTVLKTYENMAIVSSPVARDDESGESIVFQIDFQQVNVVKLQTVTLETEIKLKGLTKARQKQVSPGVNAGRSVGTSTTASIV